MKQIKTIEKVEAAEFDKAVNAALAEGWELVRRQVLEPYNGHTCEWYRTYYAEMEKNEITEAERCCDNCKHCDKSSYVEPCNTCEDASNWEEE